MSRKWDEIQQGSFPEWINYHLSTRNLHIDDLSQLSDGLMLVELLEILSGKKVKRRIAKPKFLQQKIDNVNVCLQFLQTEIGLKVIGCNPQDIVAGNTKQIMGVIFLLIQHFKQRKFEFIESTDDEHSVFSDYSEAIHDDLASSRTEETTEEQEPPEIQDETASIQEEKIEDNSSTLDDEKKDDNEIEDLLLSPRSAKSRRDKKRKKVTRKGSRRQPKKPEDVKSSAAREQEMIAKRATIANEILQTERSYVSGLTVLLDSFLRPLRTKNILSAAVLRRIFSDIEVLYGFNCQFLTNLEARMEDWDAHEQKLGDIFLREVDYLKMYTMYVNNYNEGVKEVATSRKRVPKFAEFVDTVRYSDACKGLDLTSFLIMPVQRIPRYVLLLADLLKNTPPTHVDYLDLKAAVEKTKEVADYVNEKKREAENLNHVVEVQEKLSGKIELLEDASRRYVREGPLIDMSGSEKKNRYYFLFNDIIVAATQGTKEFRDCWKKLEDPSTSNNSSQIGNGISTGPLRYKFSIPLSGTVLKETSSNLQDLDTKWKNMFQVIQPGTESKIYSFVAPTYDTKLSWMGDIDECIMQQLDIKKMRFGAFNDYDFSDDKGFDNKSGILSLQSAETNMWKDRYIVLRNGFLQIFKDEETTEPKVTLEIYSCSVRLHRPAQKEFAFQILAAKQIYYFCASSGEELFDWINAIRSSIERIMKLKDKQSVKTTTKYNVPPILGQMLTDDENQMCADCSSPEPKWANITQGVFLCDECYNLHKILSASVLKSLIRARWTDGQAAELQKKGNKIVNGEKEPSNCEKITPNSPYETRVNYIKEKYNYSEYVTPSTPEVKPILRNSPKAGRKSGWLMLLNDNDDTKNYFFTLKKTSLFYFKSEKTNGTPRGVIDIQTATSNVSGQNNNIFEIITPSRIYTILCPSPEERSDWIRYLNHAKTEKPSGSRRSLFRKKT